MAEKETKNPPQDDDEDMSSDDEEYIPKEEPEELEERALDAKFEVAEDDPDDPGMLEAFDPCHVSLARTKQHAKSTIPEATRRPRSVPAYC